jgi:L-amino acid N-acyltransferase YncA
MAIIELNSNFIIRRPSEEDYGILKEFIENTKEFTKNNFGEHEWEETIENTNTYEELINQFGKGNILLGFINDELSGVVVLLQRKADKFKHVGNLTLCLSTSDLMGSLGKELISRMILACKSKGIIRKVNLRVREDLESIKEVFKALGFYEEGTLARDICLNGMFYSTILYGRSID